MFHFKPSTSVIPTSAVSAAAFGGGGGGGGAAGGVAAMSASASASGGGGGGGAAAGAAAAAMSVAATATEETSVDLDLLKIRCRRMKWVLQDAEEIANYFIDKDLSDIFSSSIKSLKDQLSRVDKTPPLPGRLYAPKMALTRWGAGKGMFEAARKSINSELTDKTDAGDKKTIEVIFNDIEQCYSSDFTPTWNELQHEKLYDRFLQCLEKLAPLEASASGPSCFISYAWGIPEHEQWVHQLANQLKRVGVRVYLDIWYNQFGSVAKFIEHIPEAAYVIVVGTPLLREKWKKEDGAFIVAEELEAIFNLKRTNPTKIIKILKEGKNEDSFPLYLTDEAYALTDFRHERDEFEHFFNLLLKLYELPAFHEKKERIERQLKLYKEESTEMITSAGATLSLSEQLSQLLKHRYCSSHHIQRLFYPKPLPIDKNYIHLAIITNQEYREKEKALRELKESPVVFDDLFKPKQSIDLAKLFSSTELREARTKGNRILMTGIAGVGKSTLTQYLTAVWGRTESVDEDDFLPLRKQFSKVFLLPLRNLLTDIYSRGSKLKIADFIYEEFFSKINPHWASLTNEEKDILAKQLQEEEEQGKILWVLDGYDEVAKAFQEERLLHLKQLFAELLKMKNVILSSRPYYLNELESEYHFTDLKKLEVTGFVDENIKAYVNNFFECLAEAKPEQGEALYHFLRANPSIWGACHVPINLELICSAWERQPFSEQSLTMTELYDKVIVGLLSRYLKKQGRDISEYMDEDILDSCDKEVEFLEYWALSGVIHNKVVYPIKEALEYITRKYFMGLDVDERVKKRIQLFRGLLGSGFFRSIEAGEREPEKDHYFPHRTFQEYFAARYVRRCLTQKLSIEDQSVDHYVLSHRYESGWEILWWFTAGTLFNRKDKELGHFFGLLLAKPRDCLGVYESALLLRCWDETHCNMDASRLPLTVLTTLQESITGALKLYLTKSIKYNQVFLERFRLSPFVFKAEFVQNLLVETFRTADSDSIALMGQCLEIMEQITPQLIHLLLEKLPSTLFSSVECLLFFAKRIPPLRTKFVEMLSAWDLSEINKLPRVSYNPLAEAIGKKLTSTTSSDQVFRLISLCGRISGIHFKKYLETPLKTMMTTTEDETLKLACLEALIQEERQPDESLKTYLISLVRDKSKILRRVQALKICLRLESKLLLPYLNDFISMLDETSVSDEFYHAVLHILTRFEGYPVECLPAFFKLLFREESSDLLCNTLVALLMKNKFLDEYRETLLKLVQHPHDRLKWLGVQLFLKLKDHAEAEVSLVVSNIPSSNQKQALDYFVQQGEKANPFLKQLCHKLIDTGDESLQILAVDALYQAVEVRSTEIERFLETKLSDASTGFSMRMLSIFALAQKNPDRFLTLASRLIERKNMDILLSIAMLNFMFFGLSFSYSKDLVKLFRDGLKIISSSTISPYEAALLSLCARTFQLDKDGWLSSLGLSTEGVQLEKLGSAILRNSSKDIIALLRAMQPAFLMRIQELSCWKDIYDVMEIGVRMERMMNMRETVETMKEMERMKAMEMMNMAKMLGRMKMMDRIKVMGGMGVNRIGRMGRMGRMERMMIDRMMDMFMNFSHWTLCALEKIPYDTAIKHSEFISRSKIIYEILKVLSASDQTDHLSEISEIFTNPKHVYLALSSTPLMNIISHYLKTRAENLLPLIVVRSVDENKALMVGVDKKVHLEGKVKEVSTHLIPEGFDLEKKLQEVFAEVYLPKTEAKKSEMLLEAKVMIGADRGIDSSFKEASSTPVSTLVTSALESISEEPTLDQAALSSQRSIAVIKCGELEKSCRVVPAKPDGDCGFHATRLSLELQGKAELAIQFNRISFIQLISSLYHNATLEPEIRDLIEAIFLEDSTRNLAEWETRFKSRGYWLQEAHFHFLSRYYNLRFDTYCLSDETPQFIPEPTNESIYLGKDEASAHVITLAHVSTRLKDAPDASLNHFDAIIIEPTETQIKQIADILDEVEDRVTSFSRAGFFASSSGAAAAAAATAASSLATEKSDSSSGLTKGPRTS